MGFREQGANPTDSALWRSKEAHNARTDLFREDIGGLGFKLLNINKNYSFRVWWVLPGVFLGIRWKPVTHKDM